MRGSRPLGAPLDADVSIDIRSILDVNASLENDPIYLRELYWVQEFADSFGVTLGYADSSHRYDFNAMANDDAAPVSLSVSINSSEDSYLSRA